MRQTGAGILILLCLASGVFGLESQAQKIVDTLVSEHHAIITQFLRDIITPEFLSRNGSVMDIDFVQFDTHVRTHFVKQERLSFGCLECQLVSQTVFGLIGIGQDPDAVVEILITGCVALNLYNEPVCRGAIEAYWVSVYVQATPLNFFRLKAINSSLHWCTCTTTVPASARTGFAASSSAGSAATRRSSTHGQYPCPTESRP